MNDSRPSSRLAAHLSADVVAALLLHDDEGHFGDVDVVEKLAEALVHTVDLRLAEVETCDYDYRAALESLKAHAETFVAGWAG